MERKRKRSSFFIRLFAVLATLVAIVFGVYFALDKLIVPKYFKAYNIDNMHDLVAMVKTLYNSPGEKEMISNGYLLADLKSATKKLKDANYPVNEEGNLDYMLIYEGIDRSSLVSGQYEFSDKEIASLLDQMLQSESGILASKLPNIKYIDTININVLELIITPNKVGSDGDENPIYDTDSANVSFTCKIDTTAVRTQMANEMDTPLFLLNMIVPKKLYITIDYDMQKNEQGNWVTDDGSLSVNGRTAEDSEILLNLLVDFIFPEEDNMTVEKFGKDFGNILILGMDFFGEIEIKAGVNSSKDNGIILTI